jgi:hypothetical protein
MNMVSSQPAIPCRFVVIKYVDDLVRDEPINVAVMLQSETTGETLFHSVGTHPDWLSRNSRIEDTTMMVEILKRMEEDVNSTENNLEIFHKISCKYSTRFRFSEPRGTLPLSMEEEIQRLFEKYVTLKIQKSESRVIGRVYSYWTHVLAPTGPIPETTLELHLQKITLAQTTRHPYSAY